MKSGEKLGSRSSLKKVIILAVSRAKFRRIDILSLHRKISRKITSSFQYDLALLVSKKIMFVGEYKHSIDEKGRLAVPSKFRGLFKGGAVVTRGLDNCLFLYSMSEWKKLADKLTNLPISQANSRAFARLMLAGAMDVKLDKQGRIVLPEYLRSFAKMNKKAVLAGLYNRIEIWDEDAWEKYKTSTESQSNEIAEKMGELGI